ncbi:hypothetical protein EBZ37_12880, partial [bacterium]|nr:hypothetical protein [bacterium]
RAVKWEEADAEVGGILKTAGGKVRVLSAQVNWKGKTLSLSQALVEMNPQQASTAETFQLADQLLEQAVLKTEKKIKEQIQKIAEAKSPAELERLIASQLMASLLQKGFPEIANDYESLIRKITQPSLTDLVMHRYVSQYLTWGGLALMLIHGAKWGSKYVLKSSYPYMDLLSTGANGVLAGYMRSFLGVMVADTGFQAAQTWKAMKGYDETDDLFQTNVSAEQSLVDPQDLLESRTAYQMAKFSFLARMGMDSVLMYLPLIKSLSAAKGQNGLIRQMMQNTQDLALLELGPDDFHKVEQALLSLRSRQPKNLSLVEEAAQRLRERIRAGETYQLPSTFQSLLIEDSFQTLELNARNESSWRKIDEALNRVTHAGKSALEIKKANRAAVYLKDLLAAQPTLPQTGSQKSTKVTEYEKKLAQALGRFENIE